MEQTAIEFKNVTKLYGEGETKAVDDISFEIKEGEFITVLGSSGSGKTTTLKMINRLIREDGGHITFFGEDISEMNEVDLRRKIGYVVQQIGLFPHMTVAQNIATVPELLKWDKQEIQARIKELLELVQLDPEVFADRKPKQLSGGQQQRVGVARALAANPKVMLLDEPFGAVDAITRLQLQNELQKIHKELGDKTFVLVTHDINEAFKLGTRVLIMDKGKICQFDTPREIMRNPKTEFVADLIATVKEQEAFWSELK
ncbi:ABC transporter ATP-binding protein [Trichococcus collinsii]|uniref:ABC-type quaternary amine transporter n=1 Tax=Trichococcus collinsii TaxID=157076 RepID=A0AB38A3L3_9LACT|nr:ABC transporter ATP-binding protein [Trichococcus collinsii]CZR02098.1 abc transporter [Trichococcus collinsii]SEA91840.1 osmoprotectant transport system ATP-binding protein [Trichococcus collinsii]